MGASCEMVVPDGSAAWTAAVTAGAANPTKAARISRTAAFPTVMADNERPGVSDGKSAVTYFILPVTRWQPVPVNGTVIPRQAVPREAFELKRLHPQVVHGLQRSWTHKYRVPRLRHDGCEGLPRQNCHRHSRICFPLPAAFSEVPTVGHREYLSARQQMSQALRLELPDAPVAHPAFFAMNAPQEPSAPCRLLPSHKKGRKEVRALPDPRRRRNP